MINSQEGNAASQPKILRQGVQSAEHADYLALQFVAEAGKQMLESSSTVSEVIEAVRRILPVVGLAGCAVDASPSMLLVSYSRPGRSQAQTLMAEVRVSQPRLERLVGTLEVLERVERRELAVEAAWIRLQRLRDAPEVRQLYVHLGFLVSVAGWVLFLNGGWVTILVAIIATVFTFPIVGIARILQLPAIAHTFFAAAVIVAIPNLLARTGISFAVGVAVAGGLFIHLPGRSFTSGVIDGLANAPISAMARSLEATIAAGSLVLGVLVGGYIGVAGHGVELKTDSATAQSWSSVLGVAVALFGISLAWGMPRNRLVPTIAIGTLGWLVVALANRGNDGATWIAYLVAAVLVGLLAKIVAYFQGGGASVYTGVAILPLVPGFEFYKGVMALTRGLEAGERGGLGAATAIALAVAGGIAIGLAWGNNLRTLGSWLTARR